MSKNKMTIIMMTLLTFSALGGVIFAHAQDVDENRVPADNMLSLLLNSENEVTILFETIVNDGGIAPEDAQEAFEEAQQLHLEAQSLFEEANYEDCIEKATEALNKYGEALDKATVIELETPDSEDDETEHMMGLFTAIEKSRSRISTLLEIADNLDTQEVDTTDARALLASAIETLDEIQASLESGDFDEQEIVLGEANSLIGQATGMLKNKGEPKKQEKIQRFIEQTRHRVGQLNKKMVRIFNHRGISATDDITGEFDGIIEGLDELDLKDDLKKVIAQLKTLVKNTNKVGKNKGGEILFDDETIEAINTQTKMEERIERYRKILLELEVNVELKLELETMLVDAEDLLGQAEEAMGLEDKALAEELTEEAEAILDEFDDLIDNQEKSKDKSKSNEKFEDKLEEINERIAELESHIAGIEDEIEQASFEDRLNEAKARRDEAVHDETLDEVEELVEQLEEDLGFETSSDKVNKDKEKKTKDLHDPEESND